MFNTRNVLKNCGIKISKDRWKKNDEQKNKITNNYETDPDQPDEPDREMIRGMVLDWLAKSKEDKLKRKNVRWLRIKHIKRRILVKIKNESTKINVYIERRLFP